MRDDDYRTLADLHQETDDERRDHEHDEQLEKERYAPAPGKGQKLNATPEQRKVLHELGEKHSRVVFGFVGDGTGRIRVEVDCDDHGNPQPASTYILEPDGRLRGI